MILSPLRNKALCPWLVVSFVLLLSGPRFLAQTQQPVPSASTEDTPQGRDLHAVHPQEAQGPVTVPRSYALIIGISQYENLPANAQLKYPDRDAADVYTTLISPDGGQFPPENVHRLLGSEATAANIHRELEQWLPSVTKADDRVLIYFAGHGFVSGGKAYLAPYDVDVHNIAGTAYPMEELGKVIGSEVKGKWKVLITDACHSGAITPEADRAQVNQTLLDLHNSLFSLTASRDREQSFEGADWGGGHGVFTYYVIQGLSGAADTNHDGVVTADELAEYVHTNVRQATSGAQNPTSERGSFDPNMLLAYNPNLRKAASLPALAVGQLIIESDRDNTEVWLDGKDVGNVDKGKSLKLPGIAPGEHTIKGVHMGYEPDGPKSEQVYPGQDTTVSLHIFLAHQRNKAAMDLLDKGIEAYQKGSEDNYRKAAALLEQSVALDKSYSPAYVYLGRVEHALYDDEKASAALKRAIEIDPDNEEAHTSYAAVLLDTGDLDEAARQLDTATRHAPNDGVAWYLLSQALARKGSFDQGRAAAEQAVKLMPANGEAHFWLAECQRHLHQYPAAEANYHRYLELTNFDSGTAGKFNYYVLGSLIGFGQKRRAAQADIWREQQGLANFGLCECEAQQKNIAAAVPLCQKALTYLPQDLFSNFRLGVLYVEESNQAASPELLSQARRHFQQVIATNPDADEAALARKYIARIDTALLSTPGVKK